MYLCKIGLQIMHIFSIHAAVCSSQSKYFMYVAKTRANLTTYSRKPENYTGTIIFEIDVMKNSSPLNLKFTSFAMSKPK